MISAVVAKGVLALGAKGMAFVGSAIIAVAAFVVAELNTTFSITVLIAGSLAIVLASFFTMRANTGKIWRENYEAKDAALKELQERLDSYREEKHTQLDQLNTKLKLVESENIILKAKTDITAVEQAASERHSELMSAIGEMREEIKLSGAETARVLTEIRDTLKTQ